MSSPLRRAAWYGRVSTETQVDNTSLPDQRETCQAIIKSRGWELTREYVDQGLSGTDSNRPAWRQMLQDARDGKIDAVVVAKLDRFARKASDAIRETDRLADLGVDLVVVKEQIDMSTPAGRAMRTMLAGFAEFERDTIVSRTVNGQRARGRNGGWPGGEPPFGWRLEGVKAAARPVPDVREREILAEAHRLLVTERLNVHRVAERLNDAGMSTRQAYRIKTRPTEKNRKIAPNPWNPESLRRILGNPALATGVVMWGDVAGGQGGLYPRSHKTKVGRDGQPIYGKPIRLELPEPPFSQTEHKAITRALARRLNRNKPASPVSRPLTGRVYGECGEAYYGVTIKGKAPVMRCTGRRHLLGDGKCICKQVAFEPLEARVWAAVVGFLSDPARLESMARQYLELPSDTGDGTEDATLLAAMERQIEKLERARNNAARELLLSDSPAAIRGALAEIEGDLGALYERREGYRALAESVREKGEALQDLARLAERARGNLDDMSVEHRREVYDILRVRVQMGQIVSDEHRVSHPVGLSVSGVLDPRMWDEGGSDNSNGGRGPHPLPSSPAPSNSDTSEDGRRRIRRTARRHHAQRPGARHAHRPRGTCAHLRGLGAARSPRATVDR